MGKLVKQAPTAVIVSVTLIVLAIIGSSTALALAGRDASSTMNTVQLLLSAVSALTGGGALLYAGSAASSAHTAKEQTNGALEAKFRAVVREELRSAGSGDTQVSGGEDRPR